MYPSYTPGLRDDLYVTLRFPKDVAARLPETDLAPSIRNNSSFQVPGHIWSLCYLYISGSLTFWSQDPFLSKIIEDAKKILFVWVMFITYCIWNWNWVIFKHKNTPPHDLLTVKTMTSSPIMKPLENPTVCLWEVESKMLKNIVVLL